MKYIYLRDLESVVLFNSDKTGYINVCPATNPLIGSTLVATMTTLAANERLARNVYDELVRLYAFTN